MGPIPEHAGNGVRVDPAADDPPGDVDGPKQGRRVRPATDTSVGRPAEFRLNERLARLLRQKKGPDAVIMAVLSVALLVGLLGFALHFLWIIAIIVMALGLGFTVANSRRDQIDVMNERAERRSDAEAR